MMELYKKEKINPMGGCLPILVTMPIFLALYWVLVESVELRQAPWFLWIQDLTARDPYFILPALNMLVMWTTQKMTPALGMDPMQQKMMQFMPLVFGVMMAFFPSGLVLYWVTNGSLGLLQQWWVGKNHGKPPAAPRKPKARRSRQISRRIGNDTKNPPEGGFVFSDRRAGACERICKTPPDDSRTHDNASPTPSSPSPPRRARAASASCACPVRARAPSPKSICGRTLTPAPRTPCAFHRSRTARPSTTASRCPFPRPTASPAKTWSNCRRMAARWCCSNWSCAPARWVRGTARPGRIQRTRLPQRPAGPGPGRSHRRPDRRLRHARGACRAARAGRRVLAARRRHRRQLLGLARACGSGDRFRRRIASTRSAATPCARNWRTPGSSCRSLLRRCRTRPQAARRPACGDRRSAQCRQELAAECAGRQRPRHRHRHARHHPRLLRETMRLDGLELTLVDTAGLRDGGDAIEREGMRRARAELETADLALVVLDARDPAAGLAAVADGIAGGAAAAARSTTRATCWPYVPADTDADACMSPPPTGAGLDAPCTRACARWPAGDAGESRRRRVLRARPSCRRPAPRAGPCGSPQTVNWITKDWSWPPKNCGWPTRPWARSRGGSRRMTCWAAFSPPSASANEPGRPTNALACFMLGRYGVFHRYCPVWGVRRMSVATISKKSRWVALSLLVRRLAACSKDEPAGTAATPRSRAAHRRRAARTGGLGPGPGHGRRRIARRRHQGAGREPHLCPGRRQRHGVLPGPARQAAQRPGGRQRADRPDAVHADRHRTEHRPRGFRRGPAPVGAASKRPTPRRRRCRA